MNEKITVILTLRMQRDSTLEVPTPSTEEIKKAFYTFVNSDLSDYMKKYAIINNVISFYTDTKSYIERFNELFNSKNFTIEVKGSIIILKYVLDNENKLGIPLLLHHIIHPSFEAQLFAQFYIIRFIASVIAEAIRKYISPDISVSNNFLVKIKEGDLPEDNDVKELVKQIPKEGGFAVTREGEELREIPGVPFYRLTIRGNHVACYVFGFERGFAWYGDPADEKIHEIKEKLIQIMHERGYTYILSRNNQTTNPTSGSQ
jgi:hypothetical protein